MRATVDNLVRGGSCWSAALMRPLFWWRRCWTAGADGDVTEVEAAIERVAAVSTDPGQVTGKGSRLGFSGRPRSSVAAGRDTSSLW